MVSLLFYFFRSVSERGEISVGLGVYFGGWLSSFMSASGEVGSGYLGRWLGGALDGDRG